MRLETRTLLIGFVFLFANAVAAQPDPDVEQLIGDYDRSVAARDGAKAASLVSKNVIGFYDEVRKAALHLGKQQLQNLDPAIQLQIVVARAKYSQRQLENTEGNTYFQILVDDGAIKGGILSLLGLTLRRTPENLFVVEFTRDGKATGVTMGLVQEDSSWKVNPLPAIFSLSRALFEQAARKGLDNEQFLESMFAQITTRRTPRHAWIPLHR